MIDFSSNKLLNVPLSLMQLPTLEELYLDNNSIRFFPQPLRLPKLRVLQMTHNFLEFLPDGLQECTALTRLDLSHNVMASAAILPSRKVAQEDDTDDPLLRPWEWEAHVDPGKGNVRARPCAPAPSCAVAALVKGRVLCSHRHFDTPAAMRL